ncbi:hypothetical protein EZS27_044440, partial [termite gut metagenome]
MRKPVMHKYTSRQRKHLRLILQSPEWSRKYQAVLISLKFRTVFLPLFVKDCRIWMYRGARAEWEMENIEMAVPISPEELRKKRHSMLKHQSQMESAPFMGNDERLFWQRAEERNRATAALYDNLGLAS